MLLKQILGFSPKGKTLLIQGLGNNQIDYLGSSHKINAIKNNFVGSFLIEVTEDQDELLLVKVAEINPKGCHIQKSFHLVKITCEDGKPFVDNERNFITGELGRPWFIDKEGFLYIYILDKIFTNNPGEEGVYFINDVDIMLKYIIDQIDEADILVAAKETVEEAALAEEYKELQGEVQKLRVIKTTYEALCASASQVMAGDITNATLIPGNPISNLTVNYVELLTRQDSFLEILKNTLKQLKDVDKNANYHQIEGLSQAVGTRSINNKHETALSGILRCYVNIMKERDTWRGLAQNLRSAVKIFWRGFRWPGTKRHAINDAADAIPGK